MVLDFKSQISLLKMTTIFRFKLSDELNDCMYHFAKIHAYDDLKTFKEAFDSWYKTDQIVSFVQQEDLRLHKNGYTGDLRQKIFKSVRYYYRKKRGNINEQGHIEIDSNKERTKSFYLPKQMFDYIDRIIANNLNTKPSILFTTFLETYDNNSLVQEYIDKDVSKLKKAFKNRIFKLQSKSTK